MRNEMTPENDNQRLAKRLREAYSKSTKMPNNIRLPSSIIFSEKDNVVRMHLKPECVMANMQANSSSFEGWALALKRWLEVDAVEMSWNFADDVGHHHYQRLLFRAKQFCSIFPWFSVSPENQSDLLGLKTEASGPFQVTLSKVDRKTNDRSKRTSISDAMDNEQSLECFIKDSKPNPLMDLLGISKLDRQFPVGLFNGSVKKGNEIFPRGHSAIDLWGVTNQDLFLFELKADENCPIGILTELFFYSYIMEGIRKGAFKLQETDMIFDLSPSTVLVTKKIHAYVLAPKWHPLIDDELLQMINTAFRNKDRNIRFGAVKIVPKDPQVYQLKLHAWGKEGEGLATINLDDTEENEDWIKRVGNLRRVGGSTPSLP